MFKYLRLAILNDYNIYLNERSYDVDLENDLTSYDQTINSEILILLLNSIKEEIKSMKDNEVWDLAELSKRIKIIGCKWIFKIKHDFKANIERYKAKLVTKWYSKKEGIDYKETFFHVFKKISLRIVMTLVVHFNLELH